MWTVFAPFASPTSPCLTKYVYLSVRLYVLLSPLQQRSGKGYASSFRVDIPETAWVSVQLVFYFCSFFAQSVTTDEERASRIFVRLFSLRRPSCCLCPRTALADAGSKGGQKKRQRERETKKRERRRDPKWCRRPRYTLTWGYISAGLRDWSQGNEYEERTDENRGKERLIRRRRTRTELLLSRHPCVPVYSATVHL